MQFTIFILSMTDGAMHNMYIPVVFAHCACHQNFAAVRHAQHLAVFTIIRFTNMSAL